MATQTRIISLCSKTKDYRFLNDTTCGINETVLFQLLYEHHFCLNNRPFVFSIIENNFDFGCYSNEI